MTHTITLTGPDIAHAVLQALAQQGYRTLPKHMRWCVTPQYDAADQPTGRYRIRLEVDVERDP